MVWELGGDETYGFPLPGLLSLLPVCSFRQLEPGNFIQTNVSFFRCPIMETDSLTETTGASEEMLANDHF